MLRYKHAYLQSSVSTQKHRRKTTDKTEAFINLSNYTSNPSSHHTKRRTTIITHQYTSISPPHTMKFIYTTTLLLTSLALATPAPAPGPMVPETLPEFHSALTARAAAEVPQLAVPQLDKRASTGKSSGKKGGSSGGGSSSAAASVAPSAALMLGALGVGLWTL
jgi:hypothetical protein